MRYFATLLFGLMMLLSSATAAPQPEYSMVRQYVHLTYVTAIPQNGPRAGQRVPAAGGSYVVIAPGYAISARHVFQSTANLGPAAERRFEGYINGNKANAIVFTVVAENAEDDLALLTGPFVCPCVPLATQAPERDTEVYVVGFPSPERYAFQLLSKGTFQGMSFDRYVTHADATMGVSGGGVFQKQDGEYRLIGVLGAVGTAPIDPRQLGMFQQLSWMTFSTPVDKVRLLIKGTPAEALVH